jgi:RNA polymerase sigma-70 factor (ECF subfamily)
MEAPTPRRAPEWATIHRAPEWGAIHRLCLTETRRILGPGARAEDAAQEAIIRAWRHWDRRSHSDAVAAWVRTIARREAYRIARQAPRETLIEEIDACSFDDGHAGRIDAADLRSALRCIDTRDRQLLLARYWQELPHAETARRLGLTEATVRVRLHRLHNHLRAVLREPA